MEIEDLPPVQVPIPLPSGQTFTLLLHPRRYITIGRVLMLQANTKDDEDKKALRDGLMAIALIGGSIAKSEGVTHDETALIGNVLAGFAEGIVEKEEWKHPDDAVFSLIYLLLRTRTITRGEAAHLATRLLNEPKPLEQDAFRNRVNRWVAVKGLDPIGQTKRRPRT